jgi:hypothetical protein
LNQIFSNGTDMQSITNQVVGVAQGGTGSATLTANNVLLGNGVSAVQVVAPGASGNVLTSDGTTWTSVPVAGVTAVTSLSMGSTGLTPSTATTGAVSVAGTLNITNGGTGATSASQARTSLGVAASGANSDITSLSGLTTPLSVAQGGTASTTAADARTSLDVPSRAGSGASGTWGISITGNAATATNGITTGNIGSYAPTLTGTGASGTWGISITGNAATATNGLTTGNYNSYAPTLTGGNASGTWGINITGNANYANTAGNGGVTSIAAGTGISISSGTGAVTVNVVTATGAVGTYAYLAAPTSTAFNAGSTYAGSGLRYSGFQNNSYSTSQSGCCPPRYSTTGGPDAPLGGTPSGTWQAMGTTGTGTANTTATLFIRVS